jgi:hypothetical protein
MKKAIEKGKVGFSVASAMALALAILFCVFETPTSALAAGRQQLHRHVPDVVKNAQLVGRVEGSKQIRLAISLPLQNQETLQLLLKELYDSNSPNYRKFLTPEQFADMFGPNESDHQAVINFARSHNLTVTDTYTNRALVDVIGTATNVEKAFYVHLNNYQRKDGSVFYAPDTEPSLDLDVPLSHVSGLDNLTRAVTKLPTSQSKALPNFDNSKTGKKLNVQLYAGTGSDSGYFIGSDFTKAYVPCTSMTGKGQSVALVEINGYLLSDFNNYISQAESLTNMPVPNVAVTYVLKDGFNGTPTPGPNSTTSWAGFQEVELDMQMAIAMAPGLSNIVVYEGNENDLQPDDIFTAIANPPAGIPFSNQISCSMGFTATSYDPVLQSCFNQFAVQGQSFFQAAGDTGAYVTCNPNPEVAPPTDLVSNLTVVGGTELTTGSGQTWISETTWNNPAEKPAATATPFSAAVGGGGICGGPGYTPVPIPTYQVPFVNINNRASTIYRNIPDVSLVSDYLVAYFSYPSAGMWTEKGTSAAAPLWAGFMSLVNQQAVSYGKGPIGFANPTLYNLASNSTTYSNDFHDIADNSNNNYWNPTVTPIYKAVANYDLDTGLGTIKCNLINDLVGQLPTWTPTFSTCISTQPGSSWTPGATGTAQTGPGLVYNGKMWLFSGGTVWSSTNGTVWTNVFSPPFLSGRLGEQCIVYNNAMWIIGGVKSSTYMNDVWYSTDGKNWISTTSSAAFSFRSGFGIYSLNGYMWVIGGLNSSGNALNDVWYSSDGAHWYQDANASFSARYNFSYFTTNGAIWVIAGTTNSSTFYNDVWYSTNGTNWIEATSATGFQPRSGAPGVVCGNVMWILNGGSRSGSFADVWASADGVHWINSNNSTLFLGASAALAYGGSVWTIAPVNSSGNWTWSSGCCQMPSPTPTPTLSNCSSGQPGGSWTAEGNLGSVIPECGLVYNGVMWIFGSNGDVYNTVDGNNLFIVSQPSFLSGRGGQQCVVYNGAMWVIGGMVGSTCKNDAWYSTDGVNWTQATSAAAFSARYRFGLYSFNGYMWVVGGQTSSNYLNDVWRSTDGVNWTQVTNAAGFSVRAWFSFFTDLGAMWVIGGTAGSSAFYNDVWYSSDGSSWTNATSAAAFQARCGAPGVLCGDVMWIINGGSRSGSFSDVWTSVDGINWTKTNSATTFSNANNFAISYNENVWTSGTVSGSTRICYSGCCVQPTSTPGGILLVSKLSKFEGEGPTLTPTYTPLATSTLSATPTPTQIPVNALQVVAEPNISRGGQPVQFKVLVGEDTRVQLVIYDMLGEQVYTAEIQVQPGLTALNWPVVNNQNIGIASGMYIYVIREGYGAQPRTVKGKVVIIH